MAAGERELAWAPWWARRGRWYPRAVPSPLRLAPLILLLAGCYSASMVGPGRRRSEAGPEPVTAPVGPATQLLVAQVQPTRAADREQVLPVRAAVHLLFSRPVDPLTLVPQHFVLALADGRRVAPVAALLGAEPGAQRSVTLLLADTPPPPKDGSKPIAPLTDPISVTITGLLHDVDGRVLEGLAVDLVPRTQPVFAVLAEPVAPGPGCEGRGQALRVLWSAPVRRREGGEAGPWPVLVRADGTRGPADAVALLDADEALLEFCAPGAVRVVRVELPVGAAQDGRGQATAAGDLPVTTG